MTGGRYGTSMAGGVTVAKIWFSPLKQKITDVSLKAEGGGTGEGGGIERGKEMRKEGVLSGGGERSM